MMENMNITSAQYADENNKIITAIIDNVKVSVPTNPGNRHYAEILRQVETGTLTIADYEPLPADN